jgi:hypothetical protein
MAYAATFDIERPEKFARSQLALRILLVAVLAIAGAAVSWVHGLLWLAVPVVAAILISQKGARRYHDEAEGNMTTWLRFIVGAYAYLALLTDKLPGDSAAGPNSRFQVTPTGTPTVGGTLVRIILVIPHIIVLAVLGIVGVLLLIFAAVMILINESYPGSVYNFLRGWVRWEARVLAYLAALVDEYPPFSLGAGGDTRQLTEAVGA